MSDSQINRKIDIEFAGQPGITRSEYEKLQQMKSVDLLIVSDTHGRDEYAAAALGMKPSTHLIVHLGDHVSDIARLRGQLDRPILAVRGNCDGFSRSNLPDIIEFAIADCRIIMTHGHNKYFEVKRGLDRIKAFVMTHRATPDLMLYGHTHIYHDELINVKGKTVRLMNPGSCAYGISAIFVRVGSGKIEDVTRLSLYP